MSESTGLAQALALYRAGRTEEAAAACRELLSRDPHDPEVWHLIGFIAHRDGDREAAVAALEHAAIHAPQKAVYRSDLGLVLATIGKSQEAEAEFRQAIGIEPQFIPAYTRLSALLIDQGREAEAEQVLRDAVVARPDASAPYFNLGAFLERQQRLDEAAICFRRGLVLDPDDGELALRLGMASLKLGREGEAEQALRQALVHRPGRAEALNALGVILKKAERLAEAEACFRAAMAEAPDFAEAYSNLGDLMRLRGQFNEAESLLRQATTCNPRVADAWNNLGLLYEARAAPKHAIACYERAIAIDATHAAAISNLAMLKYEQDDLAEAVRLSEQALALDPSNARTHWNRALALLTAGIYDPAWADYEWRWQIPELVRHSGTRVLDRAWRGESLAGKTMLLRSEMGYGDSIQFVRFAGAVAGQGARVILAVQAPLMRLFETTHGVSELCDALAPPPAHDVQATLPSLPALLHTTVDTIPTPEGYLSAAPDRVRAWRARLGQERALRVGLVWAGNPRHVNDRRRSMPLAMLEPLLKISGVAFYSLQTGERAAELGGTWLTGIADLSPWLDDFAETAAAISALDLVIAVDTAIVHLAGATGRPAWVLLGELADWRWMRGRSDSPWYSSIRLIRQPRRGDWAGAVEQAARDLTDLVRGRSDDLGGP